MAHGKSLELAKLPKITKTLITEINFEKGHRAKSMPPSERHLRRREKRLNYRGKKAYNKHLVKLDVALKYDKAARRFIREK